MQITNDAKYPEAFVVFRADLNVTGEMSES